MVLYCGRNPIIKGPSGTHTLDNKMNELKNRIAKNLEDQLRKSGY